jgi:hypothetical protein
VGLVVVSYVVEWSQTAVYGLSSDQRSLADASWGQWVTLQRLRPSQNVQVSMSNVGLQSSQGVRREMGAVKQWLWGWRSVVSY